MNSNDDLTTFKIEMEEDMKQEVVNETWSSFDDDSKCNVLHVNKIEEEFPLAELEEHDSRKEAEELVNHKRARPVNNDLLVSNISQDEDEIEERETVQTLKKPKKNEQAEPGRRAPKGNKNRKLKGIAKKDKGQCLLDEEKTQLKEEINILKLQIEKLKKENEELRKLNMEWQSTAIAKINELSEKLVPDESAANEDLLNISDVKVPDIGFDNGKEVHLGQGIKISREAYHSIYSTSKSGQHFVKGIAVCVFGSVQLARCSVTGRPSNRLKKQGSIAKPALDPVKIRAIQDIYRKYLLSKGTDEFVLENEVTKVVTYIARKITDLNRAPRGPTKTNQLT